MPSRHLSALVLILALGVSQSGCLAVGVGMAIGTTVGVVAKGTGMVVGAVLPGGGKAKDKPKAKSRPR